MKDINLTIDDESVTEQKIKQKNCFHFRSVAFLGFNDLIFRKRLMNSSWAFRKKVLTELKNYLAQGNRFREFETDKDVASLKRDYILMFGSETEIQNRLIAETKFLPPNQRPSHHEIFALVTELSQLYQGIVTPTVNSEHFEESTASRKAKELAEAYDFLDQNTPKIATTWLEGILDNAKKIGRTFVASSNENAVKFYDEVKFAQEEEEKGNKLSYTYWGFRALGFLEVDPLLMDAKAISQEKDLVIQIQRVMKLKDLNELKPESDEVISPNVEDLKLTLKEELNADL